MGRELKSKLDEREMVIGLTKPRAIITFLCSFPFMLAALFTGSATVLIIAGSIFGMLYVLNTEFGITRETGFFTMKQRIISLFDNNKYHERRHTDGERYGAVRYSPGLHRHKD